MASTLIYRDTDPFQHTVTLSGVNSVLKTDRSTQLFTHNLPRNVTKSELSDVSWFFKVVSRSPQFSYLDYSTSPTKWYQCSNMLQF